MENEILRMKGLEVGQEVEIEGKTMRYVGSRTEHISDTGRAQDTYLFLSKQGLDYTEVEMIYNCSVKTIRPRNEGYPSTEKLWEAAR